METRETIEREGRERRERMEREYIENARAIGRAIMEGEED